MRNYRVSPNKQCRRKPASMASTIFFGGKCCCLFLALALLGKMVKIPIELAKPRICKRNDNRVFFAE